MLKHKNKFTQGLLIGGGLFALVACTSTPSTPRLSQGSLSLLAQSKQSLVAFAFHSMAWDGSQLWQYVEDDTQPHLISQNLETQKAHLVPLKTKIPQQRSMAYGRQQLWLLDNENRIYQLSTQGELLNTITIQNTPAIYGAESLTWHGDELWVIHKTHISAENKIVPPQFLQIDPQNGQILKSVSANEEGFISFSHQNLYAHDQHFYLVRSSIFNKNENTLYKVSMETGEVTAIPLGQKYTGIPTIFTHEEQLFGVELLDLERNLCGSLCKGRLLNLHQITDETG